MKQIFLSIIITVYVLFHSISTIIEKKILKYITPTDLILIYYSCTTLFLIVYLVIFYNFIYKKIKNSDTMVKFYGLIYVVLVFCAHISYPHIINKLDASYIEAYIAPMKIILTIILAYIFLKERLTLKQIIGLVLVLCGLFLIHKKI